MKTIPMTERQEIAKALNFGKYPVLTYDIDNNVGSKARVIQKSVNYGDMTYNCQLYRGYNKEDDGEFYLMTNASVIKSSFGIHDVLRSAEYANAPIIMPDTEVAIVVYSNELERCSVKIVKSGKVDPSYATATRFE
jgi:hypothetical protein